MNPVNSRLLLWSRLWVGGLAWLLHFLSIWVAAEFGCLSSFARPGLGGVSVVAWIVLLLSAVFVGLAGFAAFRSCRRTPVTAGDGSDAFLGRFARVANGIFLLIIVVETLPVFFYLKDCGNAIE